MSLARLFFLRTPAVSMAMNCLPSRSKRTSTLSRVVPATSLTIIRSASARLLMNVLLPVLRRPTMGHFQRRLAGPLELVGRRQASWTRRSSASRPRFC